MLKVLIINVIYDMRGYRLTEINFLLIEIALINPITAYGLSMPCCQNIQFLTCLKSLDRLSPADFAEVSEKEAEIPIKA